MDWIIAELKALGFFGVLFHPFLMMWMGQMLHVLKTLKGLEAAGRSVPLKKYIKQHPYTVAFSFFAGIVVYGFLYSANQLTIAGAFTAGYMADSMITAFTDKEIRKAARDDAPLKAGHGDEGEEEDRDVPPWVTSSSSRKLRPVDIGDTVRGKAEKEDS